MSKNLTSTAKQTVADQNAKSDPTQQVDSKTRKRNEEFRQRIEACKLYRRKLVALWTVSIDYRRGKPFTSQFDDDQVAVPLDWTYTKAKTAALFSQVPQARIIHSPETLPKRLPWIATFERRLNDKLIESGIEGVMEQVLPDNINAAGIGVGMVSYESITEDKEVPEMDLSTLSQELQDEAAQHGTINGEKIPTTTVPYPVDKRYIIERISPADFLWPINFTGADYDRAPWIGRSGRITWTDAVQRWKLKEDDKAAILGEDRPMMDRLTHDVERDRPQADEMVGFEEIFYRKYQYDEDANSFGAIRHLVFVSGKEQPVIDEDWKGQRIDTDGAIIGATRFPIQVLTLTYLTDEAIPPSDSAIGRPQVNELNKGRSQQIQQRQRSLPVRWADINRVDPAIMQSIMRGTWQNFIPVQGDGNRIIGEVARATMPTENFQFDTVAKSDLQQAWALGKQELDETKADPNQNTSPFNLQVGKERARVGSFFCRLAEVLGGLMCLYEDPAVFGEGFDPQFSRLLKFSVLTDSTVILDASQRLARLDQFMKTYGKSGWVSLEPVLQEIASLTGLDPSTVVQQPAPRPPVEPNISLRLTGLEDMLNPLTLAFLIKSGQAPDASLIEQAKQLIQQAVVPPAGGEPPPQGMDGSDQGGQPTPQGEGSPPPQKGPGFPVPPPQPGPPPGSPTPDPRPPKPGEAHPQWTTMPTLDSHGSSPTPKKR
jgi:hypothetical protein